MPFFTSEKIEAQRGAYCLADASKPASETRKASLIREPR